jgi:hypothetical protein
MVLPSTADVAFILFADRQVLSTQVFVDAHHE